MLPDQAKKIITELTEKINFYSDEYYQKGESSINDNEFDLMLDQLKSLEDQFPDMVLPDSPTSRVGGKPISEFINVRHSIPMLSLGNVYNAEELKDWYQTIIKKIDNRDISWVCEVKIDGFAISIIYENGQFKQAVTRGNGEIGDDVSQNIKTIRSLPLSIKKTESIVVRGEVYLSRERFDQINQLRQKEDLSLFKNPRNAAVGSIRIKDTRIVAQRGLDLLLYDIVAGFHQDTHSQNLSDMESYLLPVNTYRKTCHSYESVLEFCRKWESGKKTLPFDIDGVVIKVDQLDIRRQLGYTIKIPRWAVAWKFKSQKVSSRLLGVENSIGRTGVLTPVANLEPVELIGTIVKRATLHNYDQVERLGIFESDTLFVEKGGDIIPKIVGVDYTKRLENAKPIVKPLNCPVCSHLLSHENKDVDIKCINASCPAVVRGALEHFISKKGMDIQHFGVANINLFIDQGLINNIPDIYRLKDHKEKLTILEGFGEKSIDNLLKAIDFSKQTPLNQLIYAFGISNIGEKAAKTLAGESKILDGFMTLTEEKLSRVADFGPIMIQSVLDWIKKPENVAIVQKLISLGVRPETFEITATSDFQGRSVVITGTLSKSRNEWKTNLEAVGFKVISAVSKKTSYLMVGENPGSKYRKAKTLDIKILTESEMEAILRSDLSPDT